MPLRRSRSFSDEFAILDADRSGTVTKDELISALRQRLPGVTADEADSWARGVMKTYDKDGKGSLNRFEFAAFMNARYNELLRIFEELDHSKTGRISADDVKWGLKQAAVPHMEADVKRVLKRMYTQNLADSQAQAAGLRRNESLVTSEGVTFDAFFHASMLLPVNGAEEMLLTGLTGAFPIAAPPPGTTPAMIVAAGFINGAVSRTITAPTDRLRAVLATGLYTDVRSAFMGIVREQGVFGFWNSNLANVVQVAPENGISFALNELLRDKFCADPSHPAIMEKFLLGGFAGAVAMSAVYPMYVVQNRQAAARTGQYNGMMDAVREVVRGGTTAMYSGYTTSLVRVLPLKGIMLGGYSVLKDAVKDRETGEISTIKSLGCSAVAGGAAHAATYPLHLARTVLQQPVPEGGRRYTGFIDVLSHRLQTQGIGGCYRGLPIWLCNRVPAVAIEFSVNERALDMLKWAAGRGQKKGGFQV